MSVTKQPNPDQYLARINTMQTVAQELKELLERLAPLAGAAMVEYEGSGVSARLCEAGMVLYGEIETKVAQLQAQVISHHVEATYFLPEGMSEGNKPPWEC